MEIVEAINKAESVLERNAAPDEKIDPRWQAIIEVGEFVETNPEEIWAFILKWGRHEDEDIRNAVATCLLEHLMEHHFDLFFQRVEKEAINDPLFFEMVRRCWKFGQSEIQNNAERINDLIKRIETIEE